MTGTVLVTGGAGYIGCHLVRQLAEQKVDVIVLDDLSTGKAERVPDARLVIGSTSDRSLVSDIISRFGIDTVVHMAARTDAAGSTRDPLGYYEENTSSTLSLLACCGQSGVSKFILTSTAAVYGSAGNKQFVDENCSTEPINPYGMSKLMAERFLRDAPRASDLRYVALRCFNVAGTSAIGPVFVSADNAGNLITSACRVATGKQDAVTIFGSDFSTPDGTGVRDYIHVDDIVAAHMRAIDHLNDGGRSLILNCGRSRGYSVREVLRAVERASGVEIPIIEAPKRDGDVSILVADSASIRKELSWSPLHHDLDFIVRSALRSEQGFDYER